MSWSLFLSRWSLTTPMTVYAMKRQSCFVSSALQIILQDVSWQPRSTFKGSWSSCLCRGHSARMLLDSLVGSTNLCKPMNRLAFG
ncbi:hypothetical protein BKA70DRAFT_1301941 [Coprinopsis sp. MPI-PUGE-AT-0042]|nr:hypothetical protein BKA70DRAFT_1301941 [Coprinopsis sp. MPI-PUGE-AT-0042]